MSASLEWETDEFGQRSAMATVGGRPAVLQIVRRPDGTYRLAATVAVGSTDAANGAGLENVAKVWLARVGGRAAGSHEDEEQW